MCPARIRMWVVGAGVLSGMGVLVPARCWACCEEATVTISGPSEMVVCEEKTVTAQGTPDGGQYIWSRSAGQIIGSGSSVTYKAPDDPAITSVTVTVVYKYLCTKDPNNPRWMQSPPASVTITIKPKDCHDGPVTEKSLETNGTGWLHINDSSWIDSEVLTVHGRDPDNEEDCGCEKCKGINLNATTWTSSGGHIVFSVPVGLSNDARSGDSYVGTVTVTAALHDYSDPPYCDDDDSSWSVQREFHTFRVGGEVSVIGGGVETLYENDSASFKQVSDSLKDLYQYVWASDPDTGQGYTSDGDESKAQFKAVSDPPGANMKGNVKVYYGGTHNAATCRVTAGDTDIEDYGNLSFTISALEGLVSITWTTPQIESDDVTGVGGFAYGADVEGESGPTYKIEKTTAEWPAVTEGLAIPSWNSDTHFFGKHGDHRNGEVEISMVHKWKDESTWSGCTLCTSWSSQNGDTTINDVRWKLTARPTYER
jgi:hypothetical protein